MTFNNNKERHQWWHFMQHTYSKKQINQAIATLKPDTQKVIRLHYEHSFPLKDIAPMLSRTITVIRNHQHRGIYLLYKYFQQHQ